MQEIEIFCEDCKLATPLSFFRGFKPHFRVHLLRLCGLFHGFQRFEVFFEQVFHSDCIRQKREYSPNADGVRFFGRAKTNYIIAKHVYTRRFVCVRSFLEVLILDRARPVWSGCEITCFCYIAGTDDHIYSNNYCQSHGVCPDKQKHKNKCYRC